MPHDNDIWAIAGQRHVRYTVHLAALLSESQLGTLLGGAGDRRLVVIDTVVHRIYGAQLAACFARLGVRATFSPLQCGEVVKSFGSLEDILGRLDAFDILRRSEPVVAVGGGTLLDVVGLAASLYHRGIPYVRVPTTLLAAVDVSIAMKTAVNFAGRRNRVGTYYPPTDVIVDLEFLQTLDDRQVRSGLAEMVKIAIVKNGELFTLIEDEHSALVEQRFKGPSGKRAVSLAISAMSGELQGNLWEDSLMRLADFGHSFSPMLEMQALGDLTHGEAVILDIQLTCFIANDRGLLSDAELNRILALIRSLRLPMHHRLMSEAVFLKRALEESTRHRDGHPYVVLPRGIGAATIVETISLGELSRAAQRLASGDSHSML